MFPSDYGQRSMSHRIGGVPQRHAGRPAGYRSQAMPSPTVEGPAVAGLASPPRPARPANDDVRSVGIDAGRHAAELVGRPAGGAVLDGDLESSLTRATPDVASRAGARYDSSPNGRVAIGRAGARADGSRSHGVARAGAWTRFGPRRTCVPAGTARVAPAAAADGRVGDQWRRGR